MPRNELRALACSAALLAATIGLHQRLPAQEGKADPAKEGATTPTELGSTGAEAAPTAADPARVASGKVLYVKVGCYACHGFAGQGGVGPMTGPRLGTRDDLPLEAFAYIVRNPANAMPPYSESVLSDTQIADIHAYLATSFRPRAVADIPMLRNARRPARQRNTE